MSVRAGPCGVGIAGVLPLCEGVLRIRIAGGDVLALGVVSIAESTHAGEWIATEAVGMAEVVFRRQIAAHPLRGLLERNRNLKRSGTVLRSISVDQGDECGLLGIQGWGLCVG